MILIALKPQCFKVLSYRKAYRKLIFAASAGSPAAVTAARSEVLFRPGFINGYRPAIQDAAVEFADGGGCAFLCFHLDKTESLGLPREFVFYY